MGNVRGKWVLVVVVFLVLIAIMGNFGKNSSEEKESSSTQKGSLSNTKTTAQVDSETTEKNQTSFSYGNCTVEYLSHEILENNHGETVLVVYYNFTNNDKDKTHNFSYFVNDKAFQNGIELETSWWHANAESKNSSKDIQYGTTLKVSSSYVLGESRDNVTIEFRPFNIWSDKLLMSLELELE